jgi:hypothetical protein
VLQKLERVVPETPGRPEPDPDHPMRAVTLQVAFEPGGWTPERAERVGQLFDSLAPEWHTRMTPDRAKALDDALARGGPFDTARPCLELGSGIGLFTPAVVGVFGGGNVIALDLSREMLVRAPADLAPRVQADSSRLPFADGRFATAVLVNMLLFPEEVARVAGTIVWVNTVGDATPIHLSAEEVERALPGDWEGVHAQAGWGTWAVFRRASS